MHGLPEYTDIQLYAHLIFVRMWYNLEPEDIVGNAVVEIIFKYNDKYIIAYIEGGREMVQCNQFCCHPFDANDVTSKYLMQSSSYYNRMQQSEFNDSRSYKAIFDGPIKEINKYYLRHKWRPFEVIDGKIQLNHGCLWYAMNLFSEIAGTPVPRLRGSNSSSNHRIKDDMIANFLS